MTRAVMWVGRVVLVGVVLVAVLAVSDPEQRLSALHVRGDRLTHGALSYGITVSLVAAFPGARPWALAGAVLAIGGVLEALQLYGLFAGDAQQGDLLADAVGVSLALVPILLGQAGSGARSSMSRRDEA